MTPVRSEKAPKFSRVTARGQITIPAELRRVTGIGPSDSVEFVLEGRRIVMTKVQPIARIWNAGQSAMMTEWNNDDENAYNDLA